LKNREIFYACSYQDFLEHGKYIMVRRVFKKADDIDAEAGLSRK